MIPDIVSVSPASRSRTGYFLTLHCSALLARIGISQTFSLVLPRFGRSDHELESKQGTQSDIATRPSLVFFQGHPVTAGTPRGTESNSGTRTDRPDLVVVATRLRRAEKGNLLLLTWV